MFDNLLLFFDRLLSKTRPYQMAQWVKDKPFLSLNPTEKSEILAFVCNEMLFNKSVLHQIECNVERVNRARKVKLIYETKLRRLKSTQSRKFKSFSVCGDKITSSCDNSTDVMMTSAENSSSQFDEKTVDSELNSTPVPVDKDDDTSVMSESANDSNMMSPPKKVLRVNERNIVTRPAYDTLKYIYLP